MTEFSVVIPTVNRKAMLRQAIQSVLAQTLPAKDIAVVDDGSTDGTAEALKEWFGSKVTIARTERQGQQAATNAGAAVTSGAWIALLDDDDLWHPDYLRCAAACIQSAPDVAGVFTSFSVQEGDRISLPDKFAAAPAGYWENLQISAKGADWFAARFPVERTFFYRPFFPSGTIVRRDVFDALGGFHTAVRGIKSQDYDFNFRLLASEVCGFVTRSNAIVRKHGGNSTANSFRLTLGELQIFERIRDIHHALLNSDQSAALEVAIDKKRHEALRAAFTLRDRKELNRLGREIQSQLSKLERIKLAMARLPFPLANIAMTALNSAGTMRVQLSKWTANPLWHNRARMGAALPHASPVRTSHEAQDHRSAYPEPGQDH